MQFLSYNLLKHKAVSELHKLAEAHTPDVLCLQEANVDQLPDEIGNLKLAIGTQKNRLGLAIYLDDSKFEVQQTASFSLRNSAYDRIAAPAHERLLGVLARNRSTEEVFSVGSFHASPLTALNSIRREQIHDGLTKLDQLGVDAPLMMLGDFNYPIFRKRLEREMKTLGFELYTSNQHTYKNYGLVRGYFDFAAGKRIALRWIKTLEQGLSDHLPILAQIDLPGSNKEIIVGV